MSTVAQRNPPYRGEVKIGRQRITVVFANGWRSWLERTALSQILSLKESQEIVTGSMIVRARRANGPMITNFSESELEDGILAIELISPNAKARQGMRLCSMLVSQRDLREAALRPSQVIAEPNPS